MLLRIKGDAIAATKRATGLESVPETRTTQSESCTCNVMCMLTDPALACTCIAGTYAPCVELLGCMLGQMMQHQPFISSQVEWQC